MSFSSRTFHDGVNVPKKAASRSDVLFFLDDALLRISKDMTDSGYEPNWGSTKIATSEVEYDTSLSITGGSLVEETYPARFEISVEGVKRV